VWPDHRPGRALLVNGEQRPGQEQDQRRSEPEDAEISRSPELAPVARLTEKCVVDRGFGLDDAEGIVNADSPFWAATAVSPPGQG
jgi:hypothetical protein